MSELGPEDILVVGMVGSLRPGSYTRMAVEVALRGARELGARTQLLDLRDYTLPFCDGPHDAITTPDTLRLRAEVSRAHGLILGTPEYHASFSGVLKNALDLLGFAEVEGKMIGLVGVSGGQMGALEALNGLRAVGRALHGWVVPDQVAVSKAWSVFDTQGEPTDRQLDERLRGLGRQVARFAYLHSSEKVQEFLRAWEAAPVNPGGG